MDEKAKQFFQQILQTPSASGFEEPVQAIVREYASKFAEEIETDLHGNVSMGVNVSAPLRVMLAGHADQIGLIVTHITEEGYIYFTTIGGWDPQQLIGQRMQIHTQTGPIPAIIARKAIHLLTDEERKKVMKPDELWLDMGASSGAEVKEVVRIGDSVTLELGMQEMRNDLANAPGMDDKTGLWVAVEAVRRAQERGGLNVAFFAVATVQEEIGLRGAHTSAHRIKPQVGIAIDVTHATDCPTVEKKQEGDIKLGGGPVITRGPNINPVVYDRLVAASQQSDIPCQWSAYGRGTGTDANAIQLSRDGVAAGLVSIPNRYMHSAVEMISLKDIDRAADLLAEFALNIEADADFTPGMTSG